MKKTPLLLLILLFFVKFQTNGQIAFSTEYGGAMNEDGRWMEQMPDSGFILVGGTTTYSNGQTDMWLVRTDKFGNVMWTKSIGGAFFDFANMVKPVNGGFVVCGVTNRNGDDDAIIVKTNSTGTTIWETVLQMGGIQWFEGFIPTTDGGYAAIGVNTGTGTHGWYDMYLVKFNASGVKQWEKNIGGQDYEIGNSIQQTSDGGFIISGQTYSYGSQDGDYYLAKTDSLGNLQWDQTYAQPHIQECHYAQITPDGGYILVGDADTLPNGLGNTDVWMIKTDSLGVMQWDQVYGGTKKDGGKTVENTSDGGFIIGGITRSFPNFPNKTDPNYFLVKTDGSGTIEWDLRTYGSDHHDHAYRAIETSDAGFAEFGYFRNAQSTYNFSLVKLGPGGGITRDISVSTIESPLPIICRSIGTPLSITLENFGATNESNILINLEIDNGSTVTTVTDTFIGSLAIGTTAAFTLSNTFDFNVDGHYSIKAYTTHRSGDISYSNDTAYLELDVIPPVGDPTTTSAISCVNAALTLNATAASAATDSMFWYDSNAGTNLISTGNTYTTPTLNSTTTYYVQSMKGKGSMTGLTSNSVGSGSTSAGNYLKFDSRANFILVSVKVYPATSGNRTIQLRNASGAVLQQKTVNLPVALGGMRVYLNFNVPKENDLQLYLTNSSEPLFRNSSGAVYPYSVSQTLEIFGSSSSNATTYYYFYDWYVFVPSQSCASNMVPVQGVITNGSTTALDRSRCGNGSVTLTANSNVSVSWYDSPTGGNLLHSGNTFTTPSLSSTTTYYLQSLGCANRTAVDAIINNQSSPPTANDVTNCGPGNVTLNATAADPISWYSAASNGVLIATGNQFITPHLNSTTTYYAVAGTACPSSAVAVDAIIDAANPPTVTGATACGPASVTLSASSPDPVRWYTVPTGGSVISTNNSYTTPVLSGPTTYYVETGNTCSSIRVPVVANVIVTDPPVATNGSRCGAGTVVISAQSLNSITWWNSPTGGTQIGFGSTYTTPSINNTTTYYAQATNGSCNSSRTAVVATINVTTPPSATGAARCGTGTVTLNATSSDTIYWYSASSGGSPLANGTSFTTPSISVTTTYYAQASLACPSTRVPVTATVSNGAIAPATTDSSRCGTGSVTLIASSPDPITWYDAPSGGNVVGTGSTLQTPSISSTTTYYAVAGVTGCLSAATPAVATINPLPASPVVTGDSNCGPGSMTLTATASNSMTWYTASTGGTVVTTGGTYTSNFTTTTTYYVEANDGTCSSNRMAVTATVNSNPNINIGPAVIAINQGQVITLDPGPGYTSYSWSTGATTQTINVSVDGTYYVSVVNGNGCTGSDTIVVNVIQPGIAKTTFSEAIDIYPNPSSGKFHVVLNNNTFRFKLQITDVIGRVLITDNHKDNSMFNKEYDLSSYAKGMYFIRFNSENGNTTRAIIIQ